MQKLTASQKGWTAIVIALWIIVLAVLAFVLPKTSPSTGPGAAGAVGDGDVSGSLASTLAEMQPQESDAVAGELLDLRFVYGEDVQFFVPLCKEEPQELVQLKIEAAGDLAEEIDMDSDNSYMLLAGNPDEGITKIDTIPNDVMDLCNGNYFQEYASTMQGFPVHWDGEIWRFGPRTR